MTGTLRSQPEAVNPPEQGSAESEALTLHLWRLLDWRFLLPVLQPRSLGHGGDIGPDVLRALRLLDPGSARIGNDDSASAKAPFEVILLSSPDLRLFTTAAAALAPEGWICAQVRRSFLRRSGPRTLHGWKRAFEHNGFCDVAVHWHAPTLDAPSRLVNTGSVTAVRDTLSRHQAMRFGKTKELIGRLAFALHLFNVAIPEGTVTGRRAGDGEQREVH